MELSGEEHDLHLTRDKLTASGHTAEIFAAKFDPSGNLIASASMDRSISKMLQHHFGALLTLGRSVADIW